MLDPSETRAGRLAAALDDFIRSSPDVEAAAVVSFDGLPMASALPDDLEEDRLGAMSAALLSLGEQAALGLGRGQLNQVFVEGDHGFVFLMSAQDQAVLAAVARRSAKIGFMLFEMRRAADRIGRALQADDVLPSAGVPTLPHQPPGVVAHDAEAGAAHHDVDHAAARPTSEGHAAPASEPHGDAGQQAADGFGGVHHLGSFTPAELHPDGHHAGGLPDGHHPDGWSGGEPHDDGHHGHPAPLTATGGWAG